MEKSVQDHVFDVFVAVFGIERDTLKSETRLREDLNMDALDLDDVADEIEDQVGVIIEGDDFDQVNTIGDIVTYVSKLDREPEDA